MTFSSDYRSLTDLEELIVSNLLKLEFQGHDELLQQLSNATVRQIDAEGSLLFKVNTNVTASVVKRIPVEAEMEDIDGMPIYVLLHVIDGKLNELEVYRADSGPLRSEIEPKKLRILNL